MKKRIIFTMLLSIFTLTMKCGQLLGHEKENSEERSIDFGLRLEREKAFALKKLMKNISPPGSLPGVVMASPSHEYYYHWVRDASIVMETLKEEKKEEARDLLLSFAELSRQQQLTSTWSGPERNPGEPKFHVDGKSFDSHWGRPQDDGPAARAVVLIQLANDLLDQGREDEARKLYDGKFPTQSVIKTDLEYVSHYWPMSSFDLWEEVKGHHYYTKMVQRKALILGAKLASRMKDDGAALWYEKQARDLEKSIDSHWDGQRKIINVTLNREAGIDYKHSGLDVAVVLGALYGHLPDGLHPFAEPKLLSTVLAMKKAFSKVYPINHRTHGIPGAAIGRYPEDTYFGGNPWVISTATFADFHYHLAAELAQAGRLSLDPLSMSFFRNVLGDRSPKGRALKLELDNLQKELGHQGQPFLRADHPMFKKILGALIGEGDAYLKRVFHHSHADGSLAEQIHCRTGFMTSMEDLTWNYASMLRAIEARKKLGLGVPGPKTKD